MKGRTAVVRNAALLTAAMAAFACHSAHRPPRGVAVPRVPPKPTQTSPPDQPPTAPRAAPSRLLPSGLLEVCQRARDHAARRADPHEDLDSILWQQTAAEYRASTRTVYRAAAAALPGLVAANRSGKEPVVVFDLDETVFDNSRFQGRLLAEARNYDTDLWDCWVGQEQARLVPGAEVLFSTLVERRVRACFITNRRCRRRPGDADGCPQKRETLENLNALLKDTGYVATPEEVLLSAEKDPSTDAFWDDEKKARRDFVSRANVIVMVVGDDLADFVEGVRRATIAARALELEKVADRWGTSFFLLPNPSYGSWLAAVDQEAGGARPRKRPEVVEAFDYPQE